MKEYRIVCTIDKWHRDGRHDHFENARPWSDGVLSHNEFKTLEKAKEKMPYIISQAKKQDERTKKDSDRGFPYNIRYEHSNFHIQSRTVTDWK